jgi:hypothetical protein
MNRTLKLFFVLALSVAFVQPVAADTVGPNLLQNGSFDTGDFTGWTLSGDTALFYVAGGGPPYYSYSGPAALYGPTAAVPGDYGTISQTLTTTPGMTYQVMFTHYDGGTSDNHVDVYWDGALLSVWPSGGYPNQWSGGPTIITAVGSQSDLAFRLYAPGTVPTGIDYVSVRQYVAPIPPIPGAVPIPSSVLLLGSGLLGLAGWRRFRKG